MPDPGVPVPVISPVVTMGEAPEIVGAGRTLIVSCACSEAPGSVPKYWNTVRVLRPEGAANEHAQVVPSLTLQ